MKLIYSRLLIQLLGVGLVCPFTACAGPMTQSKDQPLVQDQYRLQEDRKSLDEVRKDIPTEKKSENDDLALLLNLTGNLDRSPTQIREKFSNLVSKKREKFQKDMTRKREAYVKEEQRQRNEFTKNNDAEKKEFSKKKSTPDDRRDFYNDLDEKRRDFYQTLREKRDEFEIDVRDQRKNFDDYMHEKNSEFTEEMRAYQTRYDENKKQKELDKKNRMANPSQNQPAPDSSSNTQIARPLVQQAQTVSGSAAGASLKDVEKEFKNVDQKPAQPLGTDQ